LVPKGKIGHFEGQLPIGERHRKTQMLMKPAMVGRVIVVWALALANLGAQVSGPSGAQTAPSTNSGKVLSVAPGESLALELKTPVSSRSVHKGDHADFRTTNETLADGQVAIPRDATVRATITEARRAGHLSRAKIRLEFNQIVLPDGTTQPLSAALTHALLKPQGEHSKGQIARGVAISAAEGAILGGIFGGLGGASRGAAGGAVLGGVVAGLQKGPDLDFPPGMMFEIELTKPLNIPVSALAKSQTVAAQPDEANPPAPSPGPNPEVTEGRSRAALRPAVRAIRRVASRRRPNCPLPSPQARPQAAPPTTTRLPPIERCHHPSRQLPHPPRPR